MPPFQNPVAQEAINLYHRHTREAYYAELCKVKEDPLVQFFLAGLNVRRNELLKALGVNNNKT